jgi:hypothetical protein
MFHLLQIGHLNLLERLRAPGEELIIGEGNSMINLSPRWRAPEGSWWVAVRFRSGMI